MYTIPELVDIARSVNVEVTERQIREWHRAGLLPDPSRSHEGLTTEGRAPYRFPESTRGIVIFLGRWRQRIKSQENERIWLWLTGFDHIEIDADRLYREWAHANKDGTRPAIRSLFEGRQASLLDCERNAILADIDADVVEDVEAETLPPEEKSILIWMKATMLGIAPKNDHLNDTRTHSWVVQRLAAMTKRKVRRPVLPDDLAPLFAPLLVPAIRAFGRAWVDAGPIDWHRIRVHWFFISSAAIAPSIFNELPKETRAALNALQIMLPWIYRDSPWLVVTTIIALLREFPHDKVARIEELAEHFYTMVHNPDRVITL